jgi:hypothetical protein
MAGGLEGWRAGRRSVAAGIFVLGKCWSEAKLVRIIVYKMYSVVHSMQLHVLAEGGMPFRVD